MKPNRKLISKPIRFLIYLLIGMGIALLLRSNGQEAELQQVRQYVPVIIGVVLVVLIGLRIWKSKKDNEQQED